MKTYKCKTMFEALTPTLKNINKIGKNKLNIIKACWNEIMPNYAKYAKPIALRQKILFLEAPKNHALIIQYQEQEILESLKILFENEVIKIKIVAN